MHESMIIVQCSARGYVSAVHESDSSVVHKIMIVQRTVFGWRDFETVGSERVTNTASLRLYSAPHS